MNLIRSRRLVAAFALVAGLAPTSAFAYKHLEPPRFWGPDNRDPLRYCISDYVEDSLPGTPEEQYAYQVYAVDEGFEGQDFCRHAHRLARTLPLAHRRVPTNVRPHIYARCRSRERRRSAVCLRKGPGAIGRNAIHPILSGALMSVDLATVRRIAHLSRIALRDDEAPHLQQELNAILAFVEELSAIDVEGVEPMTSVIPMRLPLRSDVVTGHAGADVVTRNAPGAEDHFFTVPKVVE